MKLNILIILATAGFLLGCSGKEKVAESKTDAAASATGVQKPTKVNPQITADLNAIDQKIQAKQYDAAVGSLLTIKEVPKTDQEEKEYQKRLYDTMETLRQQGQTDPKAQESYQMLGRAITGR